MKQGYIVIIVVVIAVAIAVCVAMFSGDFDGEQDQHRAEKGTVIFTLNTTGGYCAGPCQQTRLIVYSDGRWVSEYNSNSRNGRFDVNVLSEFQSAMADQVNSLDESKKVKQSCDSWSDGFDTTMKFYVPNGKVSVSSCDYNFEYFDRIYSIIGETIGQVEKL